jgi:Ca2+-binding EF-hand superfamily protein
VQLLARQRIPSGQYSNPLGHIFDEFDTDRDGLLTAHEVAEALRSRQVEITDEQAGGMGVKLSRRPRAQCAVMLAGPAFGKRS